MGKGGGCGASAPAQPTATDGPPEGVVDPQLAAWLAANHLERYGSKLCAEGYDQLPFVEDLRNNIAEVDRLVSLFQMPKPHERAFRAALRLDDQQEADPPIMATAVAAAAETTAPVDKAAQPARPTSAPLCPGGGEPTELWLHQKDGRIVVGKGNDMLSKVLASVNLITIFGAARTGKSTLMSLLCGEQGLFRSSAGGESFTQGIMIANFFSSLEAFSSQDGGECVSPDSGSGEEDGLVVGFVDAEGQGDKGMRYDLKLTSAPLLLSNTVIFNWKGGMQKHEILVRRKRRCVHFPDACPEPVLVNWA